MKIKIEKKFIIFPVNTAMTSKYLTLKNGEETVLGIHIRLDHTAPDFFAYLDVSRFLGQELEIIVTPETEISFRFADELAPEGLYSEPLRPQVHFTTKNGWINDPNGLIFVDGKYHMFYQYNPAEPQWNNMHWGHAVSEDLIHWMELDTALFPDERGTMFSGGAVLDEKNLCGKNTPQSKAVLLYYTTTEPFCQNLSFFNPATGEITPFDGNPVLPHIADRNRDPSVIFCEELDCYLMAIYLENDSYDILTSKDLVHWQGLQRISLEGDRECPDIFPITDENGNRKWVLMGAHDHYVIGNFDSGRFQPEQPSMMLHYGDSAYAGQSFSNLPGGRIVRLVWDRWQAPVSTFNGQMGIPMELTLRSAGGKRYLCAAPVPEIRSIMKTTERFADLAVAAGKDFTAKLEDSAYLIKIGGVSCRTGALHLTFFGREMVIDTAKNEFRVSKCTAPVTVEQGEAAFTVLIDRCSMEVFADEGRVFLSCTNGDTVQDRNLLKVTVSAEGEATIGSLELTPLNAIWGK